MQRLLACWALVAASCGNDHGSAMPDAGGGPPGSPTIRIDEPRLNESFYPTQMASIIWVATDDDSATVSCDVEAVAGGGTTIPVASGVMASSGQTATASWTPTGVAPGMYQVKVSCTDANALTGVALSDVFAVSAPPQNVSYGGQLQPLWTARCTSVACHDRVAPQATLDLTAMASYAELVGQPSGDCTAYQLVEPGAPERSYLVFKLQGSGPCFIGTRMPKSAAAFTPAELQLVRDWIVNGAPDN